MYKLTRPIVTFILSVLAISASAPGTNSHASVHQPSGVTGQQQDEKAVLYTKYYETKKPGTAEAQKAAYEIAKEYLRKFTSDTDQYTEAVRKFVVKYEAAVREIDFYQAFNAKDYAKTFDLGRQILLSEPENFAIIVRLVQAGYLNAQAGNVSLNTEAVALARKAIQLLEANKVTAPAPLATIEDARGYLSFTLGWFLRDTSPVEASAALLKAIQSGSVYKSDPTTYYLLGATVLNGEYQPLATEYSAKYAGKDKSPEQQAMFERLAGISDRVLDSMARAVALATKPEQQELKKKVLTELTTLYKDFHNNSDAGLNELLASVLSKPLPEKSLP